MFKETYFTHTTSEGIIYKARPMPEEFIGNNNVKSSGTPIRVQMIDTNEERKFKTVFGESGVFISDDGEQGYVGYYDYYIESDNSITSGIFYVHPFHRNKGLTKNLIAFLETINEGDLVYNDLYFSNPKVEEVVKDLEDIQPIDKLIRRQTSSDIIDE